MRYILRTVHILTCLFSLTLVVLDFCFDFRSYGVVQESEKFRRLHSTAGLGMLMSGFALTSVMRQENVLKTQNVWLSYMGKKFFLSILLTPFADKIFFLLVGKHDDGWKQVVQMLKLAVAVAIYGFSAYIRDFREKNDNFTDSKAFARVLDSMIHKLK